MSPMCVAMETLCTLGADAILQPSVCGFCVPCMQPKDAEKVWDPLTAHLCYWNSAGVHELVARALGEGHENNEGMQGGALLS